MPATTSLMVILADAQVMAISTRMGAWHMGLGEGGGGWGGEASEMDGFVCEQQKFGERKRKEKKVKKRPPWSRAADLGEARKEGDIVAPGHVKGNRDERGENARIGHRGLALARAALENNGKVAHDSGHRQGRTATTITNHNHHKHKNKNNMKKGEKGRKSIRLILRVSWLVCLLVWLFF